MMAEWRGYFAIEDINLNNIQRQTLRNAIIQFYQDNQFPTNQPNEIFQKRLSLDATKVIFEAKFNQDILTIDRFKNFLGDLFNIGPSTINNSNNNISLGNPDTPNTPIVTFSRGGTNYIRIAFFAGINSTWDESHLAVLQYLDDHRNEWDTTI